MSLFYLEKDSRKSSEEASWVYFNFITQKTFFDSNFISLNVFVFFFFIKYNFISDYNLLLV